MNKNVELVRIRLNDKPRQKKLRQNIFFEIRLNDKPNGRKE